jgi:transglutaminase-like putative cysteine protease
MQNKSVKFKLLINSKLSYLAFFSLPASNNYQEILNLSYVKNGSQLITDKTHLNSILVIKDAANKEIKFNAIFKKQEVKDLDKVKNYYSLEQKKLIEKNEYINGADLKIQTIANSIKGRRLAELIKNSYEFVISYLKYGNPQEELYSYKQALEQKTTDCGGFSTLLASILNAKGIPTRLVVGFIVKQNVLTKLSCLGGFPLGFNNLLMHAWIEALLPNNAWFPMDPSIDWKKRHGLSKREGGFGFIPNDRLVVSFGEDFELKIDGKYYKVPILQNPLALKKE